jgi:deazaflavin-dependent oxidoreductase (nitroreductase family)
MVPRGRLRYVDPFRPRGRLYYAFCRLSITRPGMWLSKNVLWKLDPWMLRLTRGWIGSTGVVASGLLETHGAVSGRARRTATLYFHDGDRVIIVASKLGWPTHPAWYHNLRADPDVVFGGRPFTAHVVDDEADRSRLWALADRVFPPFANYREWAAQSGRTIPLVALMPR